MIDEVDKNTESTVLIYTFSHGSDRCKSDWFHENDTFDIKNQLARLVQTKVGL